MSFNDPELLDPAIHPYSRCPFCKKLIPLEIKDDELSLEERKCPNCEIHIEQNKLVNNFVEEFFFTQAYASAQKITSLDPAVIAFIGVGLLVLYIDFYPLWLRMIFILPYLSGIVVCLRWFRKYWIRGYSEPEYDEALEGMKQSLLLWTFANVLNWTLLLY